MTYIKEMKKLYISCNCSRAFYRAAKYGKANNCVRQYSLRRLLLRIPKNTVFYKAMLFIKVENIGEF